MEVVWSQENLPRHTQKTIFLAGPTPRSKKIRSWRTEALKILKKLGFEGHVFIPESKNGKCDLKKTGYKKQFNWETSALNMADIIVFWVPRDLKTMPAFTTNIEWGIWANSGKIVFGAPFNAPKNEYLKMTAENNFIPQFDSLEKTLKKALEIIGDGAKRLDSECDVPLLIWKTKTFQDWHKNLVRSGNELRGARVLFSWRIGPNKSVVSSWILKVNVWIEREKRHKTIEYIFSRFDISTAMLWRRNSEDILQSEVILVKEFRSPGRTGDGFIHELPGGSTLKTGVTPRKLASEEVKEETGFYVEPARWKSHGSRQLAGTLSTHHAYLFSTKITDDELLWFKKKEEIGSPEGKEDDSEKTYIEVKTIKKIIEENLVDFSTLGMIMQVISDN